MATASGEHFNMRVWRGDSAGGAFREYVVPSSTGMVVLDVIHRIQATDAPDLAVRWNCKAGRCGSCSAEVNGKPRPDVHDPDGDLRAGRDDHGRPAEGLPPRQGPRDRRVLQLRESEVRPGLQAQAQRGRRHPPHVPGRRRPVQEFHKCIECFLCQNVCHVIRDHADNKPAFAGPRLFVRIAALEMHPLDTNDRLGLLKQKLGLGYCNITKCCTEVCPEGIHITDNAIHPAQGTRRLRVPRPGGLVLAQADRPRRRPVRVT